MPAVHVDPLDRAARLARIEKRPVANVLDRKGQIGIGPHIGGVFSAELQPNAQKQSGRRFLDLAAGRHRAGEIHLLHLPRLDDPGRLVVIEHEIAKQTPRQVGPIERRLKPLADEQRLSRVLEQHGIAGHQRRESPN